MVECGPRAHRKEGIVTPIMKFGPELLACLSLGAAVSCLPLQ